MSRSNKIPFPRGKTAFAGLSASDFSADDLTHLEGQVLYLPDIDPSGDGKSRRTNNDVTVKVVRNGSGGTLSPGAAVQYADGYYGTRVTTCAAAIGNQCAGIVDDHVSGTVADNDLFYIVVNGPVKANITTGATSHTGSNIVQGEAVWVADAAGTIEGVPATGTDQNKPLSHIIGYSIDGTASGTATSTYVTAGKLNVYLTLGE